MASFLRKFLKIRMYIVQKLFNRKIALQLSKGEKNLDQKLVKNCMASSLRDAI